MTSDGTTSTENKRKVLRAYIDFCLDRLTEKKGTLKGVNGKVLANNYKKFVGLWDNPKVATRRLLQKKQLEGNDTPELPEEIET